MTQAVCLLKIKRIFMLCNKRHTSIFLFWNETLSYIVPFNVWTTEYTGLPFYNNRHTPDCI